MARELYKALICGGRDTPLHFGDFEKLLQDYEKNTKPIDVIIHGGASGIDHLAHMYTFHHRKICIKHPAQWDVHGKSAGVIRNKEMLDCWKPDVVIAFPGGNGTENMKSIAREAGVEVEEITLYYN